MYAVSVYTSCTLFYHTQVLLVLPGRFGYLQEFFAWYNDQHCHSGIALLTPAMLAQRQIVFLVWVSFGAR